MSSTVDLAAKLLGASTRGGVHALPFGAIGGLSGAVNGDTTRDSIVGGGLGAVGGAGVGMIGGVLGHGKSEATARVAKLLESILAGGAGGAANVDRGDMDASVKKVLTGMLMGGGLRAGREAGKLTGEHIAPLGGLLSLGTVPALGYAGHRVGKAIEGRK